MKIVSLVVLWLVVPVAQADSYRYMHVSIETPWMIFLFLLVAVLMPFILMAILYWRTAMRRSREADAADGSE
ncbi:MAG: hypothetical protein HY272_06610 [Gammaproteobacteria bacterium]|nr:hypothetical protein [Gammaproteobacteria bacterium]